MTRHPLIFTRLLAAAVLACVVPGCAREPKKAEGGPAEALAAQSFRRDWAADLQLKNDRV